MRDRLYINIAYRDEIERWKSKQILGIELLDTKDIFMLAMALGMNNPQDIQGKKDGFTRTSYIKSRDKAIMSVLLLGKDGNKDNIDSLTEDDAIFDEAERCAELGFAILKEMIDSANGDEELLEKRLLSKLQLLAEQNATLTK